MITVTTPKGPLLLHQHVPFSVICFQINPVTEPGMLCPGDLHIPTQPSTELASPSLLHSSSSNRI